MKMGFATRRPFSAGRAIQELQKFSRFVSICSSKSSEHHCDPVSGWRWLHWATERGIWQLSGKVEEGKAEECVKDTWIESNESREEHRHVFHLQADLNRSFIIIIWKMCMLIAQRHLPAGRKDTLHFQRIYSHFPGPAVFESRARSH